VVPSVAGERALRHHAGSTMNEPIQLLHLGAGAPDLTTSAYGPFVVRTVPSLDELRFALDAQAYDAIVLHQAQADQLGT